MQIRVDFEIEEGQEFEEVINRAIEELGATEVNWNRMDAPPPEPEPIILSPGNSAYVAGEGGEVNSPLAAAQAQDEAAEALSGETETTSVDIEAQAQAEEQVNATVEPGVKPEDTPAPPSTTQEPEGSKVEPTTTSDEPVGEPGQEPVPTEPTPETAVAPADLLTTEPTIE